MMLRFGGTIPALMRRVALALVAAALLVACPPVYAQDPPPPLPRVVVDLQGLVPVFPNDAAQLAESRGLSVTELPGAGLGGRAGAHVYLIKYRGITLGVGGEVLIGRSSSAPAEGSTGLVPVAERLTAAASQVSFNFGSGQGWSYLSGGVGRTRWSVHPSGQAEISADTESLPTVNYGGGARWFIKPHLAFSLDARIFEIQPGRPTQFGPGSPRTRLFVFGAGISLK
jgi:hypothetical protein